MIDEATRQQILDAAQIVEVVSDYVQLRKKGSSYVGLCPFHNDRTPSFNVSPAKNICKCFVCEEGGTPASFIMKIEHKSYTEALKQLAAKYNIPIQEREETEEDRRRRDQREQQFIANAFASSFFSRHLVDTEEGRAIALPYLLNRGILRHTIDLFGIGYAPDTKDALLQSALQEGHRIDPFVEVGLCYPPDEQHGGKGADRFRARVIFPIHTVSGRIVGFGGRTMSAQKDAKIAKYINSPESLIYTKGTELYGLFFAKKDISKLNKCIIVEGYMDVIALHQVGICNVVATSGTALTDKQIKLIRRFTQNVTVIFDGDEAGIKAAIRGIDLLLQSGLNIKVLLLPDGHDPDSFSRAYSVEEVQAYFAQKEQDFISFKTDLLADQVAQDPQLRAQVINDILQSIALIPEPIQRTVYLQETSQRFGLDEQLLLTQVKKIRQSASIALQIGASPAVPVQPALSTAPVQSEQEEDPYAQPPATYERALLELIIRYGEVCVSLPSESENPGEQGEEEISPSNLEEFPLATLIAEELEADDVTLGTPVFKRVVREASERLAQNQAFVCGKHFANHPSSHISKLAIDLLSNRYQLSRRARKQLGLDEDEKPSKEELLQQTIREILTFKIVFIQHSIAQVQQQISKAQRAGSTEEIPNLMQELMMLNRAKMSFAADLGERVVIP